MEISSLPERVQNNVHKYTQKKEEHNENFNKYKVYERKKQKAQG